jgi:GNAT superfamily N-acetyltransferase
MGGIDLVARVATLEEPVVRRLVLAQWTDMTVRYGEPKPCGEGDALPTGRFEAPDGIFLVAELAGEPVGCGGFRACPQGPPRTAEVKRLFVVPEARGRGVARFLMAELEAAASAAAYERIWLETGTAQPEAVSLYDALGYVRIVPYGGVQGVTAERVLLEGLLDPAALRGQPSQHPIAKEVCFEQTAP